MQDISTILDILPRIARRYLFYLRSQRWSRKQLEAYQDRKLRELILHAARHVPYYRKLFEEIGLQQESFRGRADVHRIPLLDKETFRRRTEEFIADNAKRFRPEWQKTSGSTGTPIKFMLSADSRANDAAAIIRTYQWAGYYPGKRIFTVRGFPDANWEFKYNLLGTSLNFNSVKLTKDSALRVLKEINKLKPEVYCGYPFCLIMISKIAHDEKVEIPLGRYIIVTGETTSENNRKVLENTYGGKVFDVYGMTENAVMIAECEYVNKHVIDDFAYHEFVDDKGNILEAEGKGEIVGTSYYNYAMPLIRYKTRDYVTLKPHDEICKCGRTFRMVQQIEGREDDFIKTPDGKLLRMIHLALTLGKGIVGSQYVQDTLDHMYVNIVPGPDFEKDSLKEVEKHLHMRLGNFIRIDFKIVSELEKTRLGKTPFIISKIGLRL